MKLSTTTVGSGSRSVALVHGMSASSLHWKDVARILADDHDCTVTLVDLRGHGDSPRAERYAADDFSDDLVDTLPPGLDFLIGQSLGGRAVIRAAERLQPKRLIALDPGLKATKAFEIFVRYFNWIGNVLPDAALRRALLGTSWTCDADDALARVKAGRAKWDPEVRKDVIASVLAQPWVVEPPAVPSTIVKPPKSIVVPPDLVAELSAAGWDIRVKPGATHEIHVQDPAGLVDLLADLFAPGPHVTEIHVPARDIPVPAHLSTQAQMLLGMTVAMAAAEVPPFPARDDAAGWRALVAQSDEAGVAMIDGIASQHDVAMDVREVAGVTVNVATPTGIDGDDRVLLDLHGGSLIFMGGAVCTALTRLFAGRYQLRTWGPDYRMAPDHPYPAALDDCLAVYRALVDEVGADRIVLSGTSAGGNLAAATVARAKDESVPLPAALVLNTPEIDLTESGDTFRTNLGVDSIVRPLMAVNELYAAGHDLAHPYLSPLFADLDGFPPTILTAGTRDLFLSNTVRMHRALRRAGVEAELHVLEAAPHAAFMGMAPEDAEIDAEIRAFVARHCLASA